MVWGATTLSHCSTTNYGLGLVDFREDDCMTVGNDPRVVIAFGVLLIAVGVADVLGVPIPGRFVWFFIGVVAIIRGVKLIRKG